MTVVHLLVTAFGVIGGLILSIWLGRAWGTLGYVLGFLVGCLGVMITLWYFLSLLRAKVRSKEEN
jgi:hypothetical protein